MEVVFRELGGEEKTERIYQRNTNPLIDWRRYPLFHGGKIPRGPSKEKRTVQSKRNQKVRRTKRKDEKRLRAKGWKNFQEKDTKDNTLAGLTSLLLCKGKGSGNTPNKGRNVKTA